MASRRAVEKTAPPSQTSPGADEMQSTALPQQLLWKLLCYTFIVICAPIGVYFGTVNRYFEGNATYAGASAAATANIVLIIYIIMAIRDDKGDPTPIKPAGESKKEQ